MDIRLILSREIQRFIHDGVPELHEGQVLVQATVEIHRRLIAALAVSVFGEALIDMGHELNFGPLPSISR